ncbi:MAG TPA: DUF4339 domain-containing protein, partial [Tepidisphaeraceae bacterium]|nr:DUF4339 domain-containing protein [Tepidisphaeraceae bacterium]
MIGQDQFGPVDAAKIHAMIRSGTLELDDNVWEEGAENWITVRESSLAANALAVATAERRAVGTTRSATAAAMGAAGLQRVVSAIPVIDEDTGPFLKISSQFNVPGGRWMGPAVVSPQAFYLLKVGRAQRQSGGGLAGALISMAMQGNDDVRSCGLNDLSPAVRNFLDPKARHQARDVVVLPRQTIRRIEIGFNNVMRVWVGGD